MNHSPSGFYRPGRLLPSVLLLVLLICHPTSAESAYFTLDKGELPVLLVSGHGGSQVLPGAEIREKKDSTDPHFSRAKDLVTAELTGLYVDEIQRATGKRPSVLVSLVHRKYCDLNRKEEWSSPDEAGRAFHRAYHAALRSELDRLVKRHGWALLIDIHGQSSEPADLLVGTRRGNTVGPWSVEAMWGSGGVVESLRDAGFVVLPDQPEEKVRYGGGFIVRNYGLDQKIEAWQFEHGKELRFDRDKNKKFVGIVAERLGRAIQGR